VTVERPAGPALFTGRGVAVALVDSGVNARHPHVGGRLERSVTVLDGAGGRLMVVDDLKGDVSGHGTACAGVILQGAPDVRLLSVRVLDGLLQTTHQRLAEAIRWCTAEKIEVVNLSLGTTSTGAVDLLEAACREAVEAGSILVAAAGPERERSYPAGFGDLVLGVDEDPACDEWQCRVRSGASIPLGACGRPRAAGRTKLPRNFRGSSFAAARVSALVARLLEQGPRMPLARLVGSLERLSAADQ
jgi:subtilisin family serine protease